MGIILSRPLPPGGELGNDSGVNSRRERAIMEKEETASSSLSSNKRGK